MDDSKHLHEDLAALKAASAACLRADRLRLARRIRHMQKKLARSQSARALLRLRGELSAARELCLRSQQIREQREAWQPQTRCPPELPIREYLGQLEDLLANHQVVVVSGSTGSGKSTQIPKLCLSMGRGIDGRIAHTQPRRLAAQAIAARVAAETETALGELAGFCIRFEERIEPQARLKVMTDGLLLQELVHDPLLNQYDTLIIDEVHERTLNIDFLLGHLKTLLPRRPDLRLVITSATLDISRFMAFFAGAAALHIPGRSFEIETRYRPLEAPDEANAVARAVAESLEELDRDCSGDVLVFLPGEREIREVARYLRGRLTENDEIVQLFSRLSSLRQARIFKPGSKRRVILSTNVAETSLTVPRVRHVIDSGLARVSRYNPRRKLQQLPVEPISQDNAEQRRGRCGRESAGICVRLYSETDLLSRSTTHPAEIQRTHLADIILRLKRIGVDDIDGFPFFEQPERRLLNDGYSVLQEIGAIDPDRRLTTLGRDLSRFPIDPRLARVLAAAGTFCCVREALIIVSGLAVQDPRERPHERREAADRAHARFADKRSDYLWFVNAWVHVQALKRLHPGRQLKLCQRDYLSLTRINEWRQLHAQLERIVRTSGLSVQSEPASYKSVHMALLAGFPSMVAEWRVDQYVGCRDRKFVLHPASVLQGRNAPWVVSDEVMETRRPYARLAALIDAAWIEQSAPHLIKRSYETPYFDSRRGTARVTEIQRLFGLVLSAERRVELARVDEVAARDCFLEAGLVDGLLGAEPEFLRANQGLIARIQKLESKVRRRDLVAERSALVNFYAERLPAKVGSRRELLRWLRADPEREAGLFMTEEDATSSHFKNVAAYLFPDQLDVGGTSCRLSYRFDPGHPQDGVTLHVPQVLLPRLAAEHLDRLVPGMLSEKIEAFLRSLPKYLRRRFSPLREFAMAAVEAIELMEGPLPDVLREALERMSGALIERDALQESRLPDYLSMYVEILDEQQAVLAGSRRLEVLKDSALQHEAALECERIEWDMDGVSQQGEWLFPDLPEWIEKPFGGAVIRGYPALNDAGDRVELCIYDTPEQAQRVHHAGLARLVVQWLGRYPQQLIRAVPESKDCSLTAAQFGFRAEPVVYIVAACARRWAQVHNNVRSSAAYEQTRAELRDGLARRLPVLIQRLIVLWEKGERVKTYLESVRADVPVAACSDIHLQLQRLLGPSLVTAVERDGALRHDRYLDAVTRRVERAQANPGRDLARLDVFMPVWNRFLELEADAAVMNEETGSDIGAMFEECRIALFTPELGAQGKVTVARLTETLNRLTEPA